MSMQVTKDNVPAFLKNIKKLTANDVLIGIPASTAERKPEDGEKSPINNAAIAYIQETGSPANNIPARPFLVPGVRSIKDKAVQRMKKAGEAALSGSEKDMLKQFNAAGLEGQNAVRAKINDGDFTPLSDRTLATRRARGRTSTKPLVDSGQMRNAVTYVIRPKGSK